MICLSGKARLQIAYNRLYPPTIDKLADGRNLIC